MYLNNGIFEKMPHYLGSAGVLLSSLRDRLQLDWLLERDLDFVGDFDLDRDLDLDFDGE